LTIPGVSTGTKKNRILVVGVAAEEDDGDCDLGSPSAQVTFGGIPLQLAVAEVSGTSGWRACTGLFYLLDPPSAPADVVIDWPSDTSDTIDNRHAGALTIFNAEQAAPEAIASASSTGSVNPMVATIPTSVPGAWAIDIVAQGDAGSFTALGSDQVEAWQSSCVSSSAAGSTFIGQTPGDYVFEWQHSNPRRFAQALASFAPANDVTAPTTSTTTSTTTSSSTTTTRPPTTVSSTTTSTTTTSSSTTTTLATQSIPISIVPGSVVSACDGAGGDTLTIPGVETGTQADRILIVGVTAEEDDGDCDLASPSALVTFAGIPLQLATAEASGTAGWRACAGLFYLLDPPSTPADVVIDWPNGTSDTIDNRHAGALTIYNAAQIPPDAVAVARATNATNPVITTIATAVTGTWAIDVIAQGNTGTFTAQGVDQVEAWQTSCTSSSAAGSTFVSETPGDYTFRWEHSNPRRFAQAIAAFAPASEVVLTTTTTTTTSTTTTTLDPAAALFSYAEAAGALQNPLRGWYCKYVDTELDADGSCTGFGDQIDMISPDFPANVTLFNQTYANGQTLAYDRVTLDVESADVAQNILDNLGTNLANLRGTGVKIALRFRYGSADTTDCWHAAPGELVAASLRAECRDRMKNHVSQLAAVLSAHEEVISYVEIGWYGDAGEGPRSETFPSGDPANENPCIRVNQSDCDIAKEDFFGHVFAETAATIPIAIRNPKHGREALDTSTPKPSGDPANHVSELDAYSGSDLARAALYNDCFGFNASNAGTYSNPNQYPNEYALDRAFALGQTEFTFSVGEACTDAGGSMEPEYSDCTNTVPDHGGVVAEMERLHWMAMENEWASGQVIVDKWRAQGCYDEIAERLGYRFVIEDFLIRTDVSPGEVVPVRLRLRNDGFARMFHERAAYLVLDDGANRFDIPLGADPRMWAPNGVQTIVNESVAIPVDLPAGTYVVALWLPDSYGAFSSDPKYSVRTANDGTWNAGKGYNELATITVTSP
jgi:hypothetical protein